MHSASEKDGAASAGLARRGCLGAQYRGIMAFSLDHSWVWDFWLADDGALFHLYYLHAPRRLVDPELRHRNARIGHATSRDLVSWDDHGPVLMPGVPGAFDQSATWTGSVVRGPDGLWRMFYTGAHFLSDASMANIEAIGVATSNDLHTWTKTRGSVLRADPRWYETLGSSDWPEEAWRDPWVVADPDGARWHMLVTARANHGEESGRGVIGHAVSSDLADWEAQPPLSVPGQGFGHLEVPQLVELEERHVLVFSCNSPRLSQHRAGQRGGIWVAPAEGPIGPFRLDQARLLATEELYAGRLVRRRDGAWVLLAFEMSRPGAVFGGRISDPLPVRWDDTTETLVLEREFV
jgi:beta-fructofuranosidase